MSQKNTAAQAKKPQYLIMLAIIAGTFVLWFFVKLFIGMGANELNKRYEAVVDADIVIEVRDISENVSFYPATISGTELEVLAVKAPDGSLRTAFNTCQVCFRSGKGYYTQKGTQLVCENCGNRFALSDIGIAHSGCNPIPITPELKATDATAITIPVETLTEAKALFANWKR